MAGLNPPGWPPWRAVTVAVVIPCRGPGGTRGCVPVMMSRVWSVFNLTGHVHAYDHSVDAMHLSDWPTRSRSTSKTKIETC